MSSGFDPANPEARDHARRLNPRIDFPIAAAIIFLTWAAYSSAVRFGFIALDDADYVYSNFILRAGLNRHTLRWIFLSFSPDNWFPLTRLSLYIDYHLFGLHAGWYHAENILLHTLASLILYVFLLRSTGKTAASAMVALIFALHPMHVESVAWISERKDVLCAVFWFAALWAWLRYRERPGLLRYGLALSLFALGLMSKPTIVALPLLLPLLDFWPLQGTRGTHNPTRWIAETAPFFLLAALTALATIAAQGHAQTIQTFGIDSLPLRLENALATIAAYAGETFWPARLWIMHAYPRSVPAWQIAADALGIILISLLVLRERASRPWLATGWFWFLITLLPVIGLVQVGFQSRADRYMYVPMVGLAILAAFSADELIGKRPRLRAWAVSLGLLICILMAVRSWGQTQYWSNAERLFLHSVDADPDNFLTYSFLASELERHPDRILEAIAYRRRALRIRPDMATLHENLGEALCMANQFDTCLAEYRIAMEMDPSARRHALLGFALLRSGNQPGAIEEYEAALRLDPQIGSVHKDLGAMLWTIPGRRIEGLRHLERAVQIQPDDEHALANLANALENVPGRMPDAIEDYRRILLVNPDSVTAHLALARIYRTIQGMEVEAGDQLEAARQSQQRLAEQTEELEAH